MQLSLSVYSAVIIVNKGWIVYEEVYLLGARSRHQQMVRTFLLNPLAGKWKDSKLPSILLERFWCVTKIEPPRGRHISNTHIQILAFGIYFSVYVLSTQRPEEDARFPGASVAGGSHLMGECWS